MGRRTVKSLAAGAVACVCALAMAATASALDDCATQPAPDLVHSESGRFESVAFDGKGRLFFTNSEAGKLLMIRHSGAKPKVVLDGIDGPGGIVFRRTGSPRRLSATASPRAADGEANPEAGLIEVDPKTGKKHGLRRRPADGQRRHPRARRAIFASTDFGTGVDRVLDGRRRARLGAARQPQRDGRRQRRQEAPVRQPDLHPEPDDPADLARRPDRRQRLVHGARRARRLPRRARRATPTATSTPPPTGPETSGRSAAAPRAARCWTASRSRTAPATSPSAAATAGSPSDSLFVTTFGGELLSSATPAERPTGRIRSRGPTGRPGTARR